jgi:hypothetical protein
MSSGIGSISSNGISPVSPDDPDDADKYDPDPVDTDDPAGCNDNIDPDAADDDAELVPLKFLLRTRAELMDIISSISVGSASSFSRMALR